MRWEEKKKGRMDVVNWQSSFGYVQSRLYFGDPVSGNIHFLTDCGVN